MDPLTMFLLCLVDAGMHASWALCGLIPCLLPAQMRRPC